MFKILILTLALATFSFQAIANESKLIPSPQDGLNWPQPQEHEKEYLPPEGCKTFKEINAWWAQTSKDIKARKAAVGWTKTPESQCHQWYRINRVKATLVSSGVMPKEPVSNPAD